MAILEFPPNPISKPDLSKWDQPPPQDVLIRLQKQTLEWQHHELLRRDYEIAQLRDQLATVREELAKRCAGTPNSAYEVLLMLANDPEEPSMVRLRAAEAIVQLERPKLTANVNTNISRSHGDTLDAAKRRLAASRAIYPPAIDAEPA